METKEDRSDVPKSSTSQSKIISNSNKTPMEAEAKHEHKKEKSHPLKTTTKIPETQPIGESSESFRNSRQHHEQQHSTSTPGHQVIAVSASKGPAAFFNLARKFLATDEYCDLSALEGAIVSAVDAAHLLARSKLAVIVRYVILYCFCLYPPTIFVYIYVETNLNIIPQIQFRTEYKQLMSQLNRKENPNMITPASLVPQLQAPPLIYNIPINHQRRKRSISAKRLHPLDGRG